MKKSAIKNKIRKEFTSNEQILSFMQERGYEKKRVFAGYRELHGEDSGFHKNVWMNSKGLKSTLLQEYAKAKGIEIEPDGSVVVRFKSGDIENSRRGLTWVTQKNIVNEGDGIYSIVVPYAKKDDVGFFVDEVLEVVETE